MKFLRNFFWLIGWKVYWRRQVAKHIAAMTPAQLNLFEARLHADGALSPATEQMFDDLRAMQRLERRNA